MIRLLFLLISALSSATSTAYKLSDAPKDFVFEVTGDKVYISTLSDKEMDLSSAQALLLQEQHKLSRFMVLVAFKEKNYFQQIQKNKVKKLRNFLKALKNSSEHKESFIDDFAELRVLRAKKLSDELKNFRRMNINLIDELFETLLLRSIPLPDEYDKSHAQAYFAIKPKLYTETSGYIDNPDFFLQKSPSHIAVNQKLERYYQLNDQYLQSLQTETKVHDIKFQAAKLLIAYCLESKWLVDYLKKNKLPVEFREQHCLLCKDLEKFYYQGKYWLTISHLLPYRKSNEVLTRLAAMRKANKNYSSLRDGLVAQYELEYILPTASRITGLTHPYQYYLMLLHFAEIDIKESLFWKTWSSQYKKIGKIFTGHSFGSADEALASLGKKKTFSQNYFKSIGHIVFGNSVGNTLESGRHSMLSLIEEINDLREASNQIKIYFAANSEVAKEYLDSIDQGYVYQVDQLPDEASAFEVVIHSAQKNQFGKREVKKFTKTFWPINLDVFDILTACFSAYHPNKRPGYEYSKKISDQFTVELRLEEKEKSVGTCYPRISRKG